MRNKCLFALGLVFAMSLTSIVAFAFSFTGEPDVKNDQQQIVVVNPATESEETTSEQTVSAETEDTTATLQSAGSSLSGSMDWDAEDAYMLANLMHISQHCIGTARCLAGAQPHERTMKAGRGRKTIRQSL